MTGGDPLEWELDAARATYPVGDHVVGTVVRVPRPGAIGVFVDLGRPPTGFVDVLLLPRSADRWPGPGTVAEFEVLQHRPGQVRLWPLDPGFRSRTARLPMTDREWTALKERHPVTSEVTAEVTAVYRWNREYDVAVDGVHCGLPWRGSPPAVGATARFVVDRHLDATRRLLLREA